VTVAGSALRSADRKQLSDFDEEFLMYVSPLQRCLPLLAVVVAGCAGGPSWDREPVFPDTTWPTRSPEQVGLDPGKLAALAQYVGGRGCVVRHGYMVYAWGDQAKRADVASACKPWYAHFLFRAL
jgi:hypothetical protein